MEGLMFKKNHHLSRKVPMDRSAFEMDKGKCNLLGGDLGPFNPYHLSRDWPMDRSVSHTARVNTKMMKVWLKKAGHVRVLDMSRKSYTWQRTNHKTLQFRYNHHIFTILKVIRS
ncbi:hypothetical protein L5515_019112 [Caenorhabditis briggsae]|uniref:Uncharacterized protein n=1 Tax=Caenorhabditis briggsae TaxID=6238 RepID=A0AAE9JT95_CAEBR|nr:hypothetical protein L5515_019112 [Caenorhabditis briggsae]